MHTSLQKIVALPDETKVYCGHEYTLVSNRSFLVQEFHVLPHYLANEVSLCRAIQSSP
jgi:hydroxyacylglutathione hydrolase